MLQGLYMDLILVAQHQQSMLMEELQDLTERGKYIKPYVQDVEITLIYLLIPAMWYPPQTIAHVT